VKNVIVTVEGVITSKEIITKETDKGPKISTELLLAQTGEKTLMPIRLEGDKVKNFELYKQGKFTGELLTWKTRDAVGMMVMIRHER
jgi:hypothetical protein